MSPASRRAASATTRSYSARSRLIASLWAASSGAIAASMASNSSSVSANCFAWKAFSARVNSCPDASHASITLATVGGSVLVATAASSANCSAMPDSIAGW